MRASQKVMPPNFYKRDMSFVIRLSLSKKEKHKRLRL